MKDSDGRLAFGAMFGVGLALVAYALTPRAETAVRLAALTDGVFLIVVGALGNQVRRLERRERGFALTMWPSLEMLRLTLAARRERIAERAFKDIALRLHLVAPAAEVRTSVTVETRVIRAGAETTTGADLLSPAPVPAPAVSDVAGRFILTTDPAQAGKPAPAVFPHKILFASGVAVRDAALRYRISPASSS